MQVTPLLIPRLAPAWKLAMAILAAFRIELQACENMLLQHRRERNVAKYEADANQIFRDVRKPGPEPVQVIVAHKDMTVLEVVDQWTVQCGPCSSQRKLAALEVPVMVCIPRCKSMINKCNSRSHMVSSPGEKLTRTDLLGSVAEIHQAFTQEWSRLWDKHLHLPAGPLD